MPFLGLVFNLEAMRKLAERALSPEEIADVFRAEPVVTVANPNPRAEGSLWAIGPTRDGRFVTAVVEQDHDDTDVGTSARHGTRRRGRSRSTAGHADPSSCVRWTRTTTPPERSITSWTTRRRHGMRPTR